MFEAARSVSQLVFNKTAVVVKKKRANTPLVVPNKKKEKSRSRSKSKETRQVSKNPKCLALNMLQHMVDKENKAPKKIFKKRK